jgi:acetyl-CoA acetyltransferase
VRGIGNRFDDNMIGDQMATDNVYIYEAIRTPRGRGKRGALYSVKPHDLVVGLVDELLRRHPRLDPGRIDDIVLGCVSPVGEQGADIARTVALAAGLPNTVCGVQINRFCSSGLEAVNLAAAKVASGWEELVIAGGVESMSRVPTGSDGGALASDPATNYDLYVVPQGIGADRVPGPAVGVGVPIALAADIVVASQDAYFVLGFTRIGLMPDGGASLLVSASIGRARALSLALRAEPMPAATAAATGLIDKAVPAGELDDAVRAVVEHFARGPRQAYWLTKLAINAATLQAVDKAMEREAEGQARLLQSPDSVEGAMAMLQKRSPQFSD